MERKTQIGRCGERSDTTMDLLARKVGNGAHVLTDLLAASGPACIGHEDGTVVIDIMAMARKVTQQNITQPRQLALGDSWLSPSFVFSFERKNPQNLIYLRTMKI